MVRPHLDTLPAYRVLVGPTEAYPPTPWAWQGTCSKASLKTGPVWGEQVLSCPCLLLQRWRALGDQMGLPTTTWPCPTGRAATPTGGGLGPLLLFSSLSCAFSFSCSCDSRAVRGVHSARGHHGSHHTWPVAGIVGRSNICGISSRSLPAHSLPGSASFCTPHPSLGL